MWPMPSEYSSARSAMVSSWSAVMPPQGNLMRCMPVAIGAAAQAGFGENTRLDFALFVQFNIGFKFVNFLAPILGHFVLQLVFPAVVFAHGYGPFVKTL